MAFSWIKNAFESPRTQEESTTGLFPPLSWCAFRWWTNRDLPGDTPNKIHTKNINKIIREGITRNKESILGALDNHLLFRLLNLGPKLLHHTSAIFRVHKYYETYGLYIYAWETSVFCTPKSFASVSRNIKAFCGPNNFPSTRRVIPSTKTLWNLYFDHGHKDPMPFKWQKHHGLWSRMPRPSLVLISAIHLKIARPLAS